MMDAKRRMLAAALLSSGAGFQMPNHGNNSDIGRTGKRQGARLARQMAAGQLDYSASERCIARINARLEGRD